MQVDDTRPIWVQLVDTFRHRIVSGHWAPGSKIPSVRELASGRLTSNASGAWISSKWPTALVTTYCSFSKWSSCLSKRPATGASARTMSCATEGFSAMTRVFSYSSSY